MPHVTESLFTFSNPTPLILKLPSSIWRLVELKIMKQFRILLDPTKNIIFRLIRLSGKFVQLISKCISETSDSCHSIEGGFLLRYTNFGPIASFPSYEKIMFWESCLHFWKMSNIEHREVIKFFTRKGLNAIEISKELDNVYKDSAP